MRQTGSAEPRAPVAPLGPSGPAPTATPSASRRFAERLIGILGAIGVFLGAFVQFAGEDQHLGILWWTWRVGDITEAWKFGLLVAGSALLGIALTLVARRRVRAEETATPFTLTIGTVAALAYAGVVVFAVLWLL